MIVQLDYQLPTVRFVLDHFTSISETLLWLKTLESFCGLATWHRLKLNKPMVPCLNQQYRHCLLSCQQWTHRPHAAPWNEVLDFSHVHAFDKASLSAANNPRWQYLSPQAKKQDYWILNLPRMKTKNSLMSSLLQQLRSRWRNHIPNDT